MTEKTSSPAPLAPYIPFAEFKAGLPEGRFRVIVNPELAKPFIAHAVNVMPVTLAIVGCGLGAALVGYTFTGVCLIAAGALFRRRVLASAPQILLYLASRRQGTYDIVTSQGIMEVQRA